MLSVGPCSRSRRAMRWTAEWSVVTARDLSLSNSFCSVSRELMRESDWRRTLSCFVWQCQSSSITVCPAIPVVRLYLSKIPLALGSSKVDFWSLHGSWFWANSLWLTRHSGRSRMCYCCVLVETVHYKVPSGHVGWCFKSAARSRAPLLWWRSHAFTLKDLLDSTLQGNIDKT